MKAERGLSIGALMALAAVVAFDFAAWRSLAARPAPAIEWAIWRSLAVMPMIHLLGLAAALSVGESGRPRRYLLAFQAAGWAAVALTLIGGLVVRDILELPLILTGWDQVVADEPWASRLMEGLVVPVAFLILQLATAAGVGWCVSRQSGPASTDDRRAEGRVARMAWSLLLLVIGGTVILLETMLYAGFDRQFARLQPGTIAVVDRQRGPEFRVRRHFRTRLARLEGRRVRVLADNQRSSILRHRTMDGRDHLWDARPVRVELLDAHEVEPMDDLPYFALRVDRETQE